MYTEEELENIDDSMNNLLIRVFRLPSTPYTYFLIDILTRTCKEFVNVHKEHSKAAIDSLEIAVFDLEVENYNTSEYKLILIFNYLVKRINNKDYILAKNSPQGL
jgi:hypothetical protein